MYMFVVVAVVVVVVRPTESICAREHMGFGARGFSVHAMKNPRKALVGTDEYIVGAEWL